MFQRFRREPDLLPAHVHMRSRTDGLERAIADYVAGMTDRFAIQAYQRWVVAK